MNKKICILVDSLSSGGAEKVAANLSISLNKSRYNVFIVSMQNDINYQYEGELYNFGLIKDRKSTYSAFLDFISFFRKHKFDFIIDHRLRSKYMKEIVLSKIVFRKYKVIYCVHNYYLEYYFSFIRLPWLAKFPHVRNKKFVSVCLEIQNRLLHQLDLKSEVIFNSLPARGFKNITNNSLKSSPNKYIIGVGRLTKIKQFDKLINCYKNSKLPENDVELVILGKGPEKENLIELIKELNLENRVNLIPFKKNPYYLIKNALALVLSSKVEGFPMVILEALSLSTPVIAFNCKSGPNEIINNEVNGLLVEDQNEIELIGALDKLLNRDFYKTIKNNTHLGLEKFSENRIVQEWINVLENQI
ncbi:MAG: glycosyltransferase [Bacteroidia bacterium]|nr:glycosyltransferase [Bacteroidia bacterium]